MIIDYKLTLASPTATVTVMMYIRCQGTRGECRKWCGHAALHLPSGFEPARYGDVRNSRDAVLNNRTYAYGAYHRLNGINLNDTPEVAYTLNDKEVMSEILRGSG